VLAALETEKKQLQGELPSYLSPAGLIRLGSAPNWIYILVFRPADGSRELHDPGTGHTDGLQLFPIGAGGAAGRCPRDVPGD
jgi:hypothetical protein